MLTVEMHPENIRAAAEAIPHDVPIVMLNLVRYKERADYGDRADVAPCSGREAYLQNYVAAFSRIEGAEDAKVFWFGGVLANVVAPAEERWDDMVLVEYPSFAAFLKIVENPKYKTDAEYHRTAALEDSRLIATTKTAL